MSEPPDFSGQYNTPLAPGEEQAYAAWVAQLSAQQGRDVSRDTYDYDMRGAWMENVQAASDGHLTDRYKKPNHPTFSDQSQYHGADGHQGGSWVPQANGSYVFQASPTNVQNLGPEGLQQYFQQREPGNAVALPPSLPQTLAPQVQQAPVPSFLQRLLGSN